MSDADDRRVRQALDELEALSSATSAWKTQDPAVRAAYQALLRGLSKRICFRLLAFGFNPPGATLSG